MSVSLPVEPVEITFPYEQSGEVRCSNSRGLTFFLFAEPVQAPRQATTPPLAPAPAWKQVEATIEVPVRRETEPRPIMELERAVPQTPAAPQRARGTAPLIGVPEPGEAPSKGWFNRLFSKG